MYHADFHRYFGNAFIILVFENSFKNIKQTYLYMCGVIYKAVFSCLHSYVAFLVNL